MEVKINREIRNYSESVFFGLSMKKMKVRTDLQTMLVLLPKWKMGMFIPLKVTAVIPALREDTESVTMSLL